MSSILFYLNFERREIFFDNHSDITPLWSVLKYLREKEHLMGTKEGCGVGDCGACTVCLAEQDNYSLKNSLFSEINPYSINFYAVNSCLMPIAMLNGKHLFTIEGISSRSRLHPVQEALMKGRGTQCGFCSPGMIMSAYAHYRNGRPFTREEINKTLSGNLCRCTGYESILKSMMSLQDVARVDEPDPVFDKELVEAGLHTFEYLGTDFRYYKFPTLKEFLSFKESHPEAYIVSGATDFAIMLHKSGKIPSLIVDISDLKELKGCEEFKGYFYIGGNTSIENFRSIISTSYPAADKYLSSFASLQIRNKGTIAGSISGSSPVGDIMPLLLALDAELVLVKADEKRNVEAASFITSYRKNVMQSDEIIGAVIIPKPSKSSFLFCHKQSKRKDMDIATMTCCIYFETVNQKISKIYTGFGGMSSIPTNSCSAEEFLMGKEIKKDIFVKAGAIAKKDFKPISDVRGSEEFRSALVENLFLKCYLDYESGR